MHLRDRTGDLGVLGVEDRQDPVALDEGRVGSAQDRVDIGPSPRGADPQRVDEHAQALVDRQREYVEEVL